MNLRRCENGHFFDVDKFQTCPHCAAIGGDTKPTQAFAEMESVTTEPVTIPLTHMQQQAQQIQQPVQQPGMVQPMAQPVTSQESMSLRDAVGKAMTNVQDVQDDDSRTISIYQTKIGSEPVVGWLVCIEGKDFGESFKLKTGRNFIGRAQSMDVVLQGDNSISREKHAIILYEPKRREFIAQAGESRELFYLNDDVVLNPVRLKQYDIVTIGNTRLMFFPCCGENFSWEDYKKDDTASC